jgi:hypothetical protein
LLFIAKSLEQHTIGLEEIADGIGLAAVVHAVRRLLRSTDPADRAVPS